MESTKATAHAHPNTVALQACLREAIAEGPRLFKQWLNGLGEELHTKEASVGSFRERTDLINSQNLLSRLRPELEKKWAAFWEKAIENGLKGQQTPSQTRRSLSQIRFEELELMGDEQIQATVEIARIQQSVQIIADQALNDLTARLSRAQGSSIVKTSQNPLGPEVVVQVLTQTLDTVCTDRGARTLWLQHGSKLMGKELAELYRHLSHLLDEQGVAPAQYGAVHAAGGSFGGSGSGSSGSSGGGAYYAPPQGAAGPPPHWGGASGGGDAWGGTGHGMLPSNYGSVQAAAPVAPSLAMGSLPPSSLLTLNHLHQLLVSENALALLNSHTETAQAELNIQGVEGNVNDPVPLPPLILTDTHALAASYVVDTHAAPIYHGNERRKRPRGVQALDGEDLGQLSLRELAEEVVGLMLDGIAQDQRLLPPVSATLKSLRPALLKVANQNPRFFADRANPARRLLDELTQRSLAYSSTDSEGFDLFIRRLQEAVHSISDDDLDTDQLALNFEKALYILDSPADTVPQTLEAQEAEQDKAVASLLKAEQRYLVAEKIAQKIQARNDFGLAPIEVQQFLTGPWSQVVALAQMQPSSESKQDGGKPAAQAYLDLTSDLLWSCHPELASRNRSRLARVIPGLLRQLRQGLSSIGYPNEQSAPFFNVLMRCHETALRAGASSSHGDTPVAPPPPAPNTAPSTPEPSTASYEEHDTIPDPGPWLSPSEVEDARMLNVAPPQPDFAQTEPMDFSQQAAAWATADAPVADMLPKDDFLDLSLGAWIELEQVAGERQRARLKWASPHGNMYLFIRTDGKSISMTRRMYQSLVSQQRLRLVADQSVVDDALDGVMAMAVRNSTNH